MKILRFQGPSQSSDLVIVVFTLSDQRTKERWTFVPEIPHLLSKPQTFSPNPLPFYFNYVQGQRSIRSLKLCFILLLVNLIVTILFYING